MRRCLELAERGRGHVAPNPLVGAVLVHEGRIIGEGWHRRFGEAHAEVNCLDSVSEEDRQRVPESTLYVNLEPCSHTGKTPPCTDLILRHRIRRVVIGSQDPFDQVNGKGIAQLRAAGTEVLTDVLGKDCREINRRFFTFHTGQRAYVILKWARTADGFIARDRHERLLISHEQSNRLVHRWRSEEAAILVGTNTALYDNPALTTRHWQGPSAYRLVLDMHLRLPSHLHVFDRSVPTLVFNARKHTVDDFEHNRASRLCYYRIDPAKPVPAQIIHACYHLDLQSVIVEGGARLLQSFIDDGCWDEARVITNTTLRAGHGLAAPVLTEARPILEESLETDHLIFYRHQRFEE